jgi:hypothetical protein
MTIDVVIRKALPPFLLASVPVAILGYAGIAVLTPSGLSDPNVVLEATKASVLSNLLGFGLAVFWRGDRYFQSIGSRRTATCAFAGVASLLSWYFLGFPLLVLGIINNPWIYAFVFFLFQPVAAFFVTILVLRAAAASRKSSAGGEESATLIAPSEDAVTAETGAGRGIRANGGTKIGGAILTVLPPFVLATIPLAFVANLVMALAISNPLSNHKSLFTSPVYIVLVAAAGAVLAVWWRGDRYLKTIGDRRDATCAVAGVLSLLAWYLVGLPLLLVGVVPKSWGDVWWFLFELGAGFVVTLLVLYVAASSRKSLSGGNGSGILHGPEPV